MRRARHEWWCALTLCVATFTACGKKTDARDAAGASSGAMASSVSSSSGPVASSSGSTGTGGAGGAGGAGGEGGVGGGEGGAAPGTGGEGGGSTGATTPKDDVCPDPGRDIALDDAFDEGEHSAFVYGNFSDPLTAAVTRVEFPNVTKKAAQLPGLGVVLEVRAMVASPDGKRVAVVATPKSMGKPVVWLYDAALESSPLVLFEATSAAHAIHEVAFSPDSRWLAVKGELEVDDAVGLYVLASDGSSAAPLRVSKEPLDKALGVERFAWARQVDELHARLAYTGDLETDGTFGAFVADVVAGGPSTSLVATTGLAPGGGVVPGQLGWDAMNRVYFRSNHEGLAAPRLYRASVDGLTLEVVPSSLLANGSGEAMVTSFALSPDGARVAFTANAPWKSLYQVHVAAVDDASALTVSGVQTAPPPAGTRGPSTGAPLAWSPDGKHLAVIADWQVLAADPDDAFTVFVVPSATKGGMRAILPAPVATLDLEAAFFSRDSKRLLALGDLLLDGRRDFYSAPAGGKGDLSIAEATAQPSKTLQGDVMGVLEVP